MGREVDEKAAGRVEVGGAVVTKLALDQVAIVFVLTLSAGIKSHISPVNGVLIVCVPSAGQK